MSSYSLASQRVLKFADKLKRLGSNGEHLLQKTVVEVTLLTLEAIHDKITSQIEPHQRDGKTVEDLVDTGHYRASWQTSFPGAFQGKVATNIVYALMLEYGMPGTKHIPFYVARDTARDMRLVFVQKLKDALYGATQ